jgi:hypothetical protein
MPGTVGISLMGCRAIEDDQADMKKVVRSAQFYTAGKRLLREEKFPETP